ncbi:hypothetical protein [Acetivibrio clariflavus]|uniref:hypothetical protein n=1 Tax=Acetivibrio clariflavus TaxID=288965 RepID=UPI0031F53017
MNNSGMKKLFFISVISILFVSLSIVFMPFASEQKFYNFMFPVYIVGGTFWGFILIGYGSLLILNHLRKKKLKALDTKTDLKRRPGLFCVWTNLPAKIFDTLTVISLVGIIIALIKFPTETQIIFILIAVFFFSVNMHGLFNGKNYRFIKGE